jgi:hypothetical protein
LNFIDPCIDEDKDIDFRKVNKSRKKYLKLLSSKSTPVIKSPQNVFGFNPAQDALVKVREQMNNYEKDIRTSLEDGNLDDVENIFWELRKFSDVVPFVKSKFQEFVEDSNKILSRKYEKTKENFQRCCSVDHELSNQDAITFRKSIEYFEKSSRLDEYLNESYTSDGLIIFLQTSTDQISQTLESLLKKSEFRRVLNCLKKLKVLDEVFGQEKFFIISPINK